MAESFVLVHGAWHGGWCWAAVVNELGKRGDRAHAVDLPGNNANPFDRAKVNLNLYVDSVAKYIEERDLRNVVLAGHSMAGVILPGVVTKLPKRIKRAVWVSAMVPEDRKPMFDAAAAAQSPFFKAAQARYDKSMPIEPVAEAFRAYFMQDGTREMQDYVMSCLCPQPIQPFLDSVDMTAFHATGVPQSFLVCSKDLAPDGHPQWHPTWSGRLKNASIRTIDSGHEVMFTKPRECAEALYEFARE